MATTDLADWLVAMEAAMRIGCSTRTIERLGRAKKLEQRLRRQEGTPPVAVYNPDDVARIAQERHPEAAPFVLDVVLDKVNVRPTNGNGRAAPTSALSRNRDTGDDPIRQLAAAFQSFLLSPPSPPKDVTVAAMAERLYLTLDEAAAFTGLSRTFLRRMIKLGTLTAIKDRGHKIRRKDLEAL